MMRHPINDPQPRISLLFLSVRSKLEKAGPWQRDNSQTSRADPDARA